MSGRDDALRGVETLHPEQNMYLMIESNKLSSFLNYFAIASFHRKRVY